MNNDLTSHKLDALGKSKFRQKFSLRQSEREIVERQGWEIVHKHTADIISKRLAPAKPYKDGKQTPYRGHPVFVAQHATATCCRNCLARWHQIAKGQDLTTDEQGYVVEVIESWIKRQMVD